jgi:hypothetical protein
MSNAARGSRLIDAHTSVVAGLQTGAIAFAACINQKHRSKDRPLQDSNPEQVGGPNAGDRNVGAPTFYCGVSA